MAFVIRRVPKVMKMYSEFGYVLHWLIPLAILVAMILPRDKDSKQDFRKKVQ